MRLTPIALLAILLMACSAGTAIDDTTPSQDPVGNESPDIAAPELGVITFGIGLNQETLKVRRERTNFTVDQKVAWSAALSEPVGSTSVQIVIAERHGGGSESVAYEETLDVANPDFDLLANNVRLGSILGVGRFVMRYVNADGEVLAEGAFRIKR